MSESMNVDDVPIFPPPSPDILPPPSPDQSPQHSHVWEDVPGLSALPIKRCSVCHKTLADIVSELTKQARPIAIPPPKPIREVDEFLDLVVRQFGRWEEGTESEFEIRFPSITREEWLNAFENFHNSYAFTSETINDKVTLQGGYRYIDPPGKWELKTRVRTLDWKGKRFSLAQETTVTAPPRNATQQKQFTRVRERTVFRPREIGKDQYEIALTRVRTSDDYEYELEIEFFVDKIDQNALRQTVDHALDITEHNIEKKAFAGPEDTQKRFFPGLGLEVLKLPVENEQLRPLNPDWMFDMDGKEGNVLLFSWKSILENPDTSARSLNDRLLTLGFEHMPIHDTDKPISKCWKQFQGENALRFYQTLKSAIELRAKNDGAFYNYLMSTGNRYLVYSETEDNMFDHLGAKKVGVDRYKGGNMLGRVLMEVRYNLQQEVVKWNRDIEDMNHFIYRTLMVALYNDIKVCRVLLNRFRGMNVNELLEQPVFAPIRQRWINAKRKFRTLPNGAPPEEYRKIVLKEIVPFLAITDSNRFEELFYRLPLNVQRQQPDFVSAIRPHYFSNVASKDMEAVDQYLNQLFQNDKVKIAAFVEGVMNEDNDSEMNEKNFLAAVRANLNLDETRTEKRQVIQNKYHPTEGNDWSGKYVPREFSFGPYLASYRKLMEAFPVEEDSLQYEPVLKSDHRLRISHKLYSARRNPYDMHEKVQKTIQTIRTGKDELAKAKNEEDRGKIMRRINRAMADIIRDSDEEYSGYDEYGNPSFEIIQPVDFTMEDVASWLLNTKQTDILKSIAIRNNDIQLDTLLNLINVGALAPDFNKSEQTAVQKQMAAGYNEETAKKDEKKADDADDADEDEEEAPVNRLIAEERNTIFQRIVDLENAVPDNEQQRLNFDHELNNLKKLHKAYSELEAEDVDLEAAQERDVKKQKEMYLKELSASDVHEDVDQFLNHFLIPQQNAAENKAYEKTEFRLRRLWQTLANLARETNMKRGLMKTLLSNQASRLETLDFNVKKSRNQYLTNSFERHKNEIKMYIGTKILTLLRNGVNVVNLGGVNLSTETAYQVLDALLIMDNLNENVPNLIARGQDFQLTFEQAEKVFPFITQTYTRFASEGIPKTGWVPLVILENSFETHALNKSIVQVVNDVYENIVSLVQRWIQSIDQVVEEDGQKNVEWIKRLLNAGNYEFFLLDEILNGELGLEFAMQSFVKRNAPKQSDSSVDQRQAKAYLGVMRAIGNAAASDIVLSQEYAKKEYLLAEGRTLKTDDDKFVLSDREREYWKKYGALGLTGDYEHDPRWTKQDEERWKPIVEKFRASPEYQHYLYVKRGYTYPTLKDFVIANSNADVIVTESNQVHRFQFEHLVHDAYHLARDAYLDTNVWQPMLGDMENFLYRLIADSDANMGWRRAREESEFDQTSKTVDELLKRIPDRNAELQKMRQDGRSEADIAQRRDELDAEIDALRTEWKSGLIPTIQQLKQRIEHLRHLRKLDESSTSQEELDVLSEELKNARSPETYVETIDPFWKWLLQNHKRPRVFTRLMTSIVWDNFLNLFEQAQKQSRVDMQSIYTKSDMINNPDVLDGIEPFFQQRVQQLTEQNFHGPISRDMAQSVIQQLGPTIKADVEGYIRSRPLLVKDGLEIDKVGDFFFSRGFVGAPPVLVVATAQRGMGMGKDEFSTEGMDVAEFNDSNLLGWKNTRFSFDVQAPRSTGKKKNSNDVTAVSKWITHLNRIPAPLISPSRQLRPSQLFANRPIASVEQKPKSMITQGVPPVRYRSLYDFVYRNLTLHFAQKLLSVNGLSFDPARLLVAFAIGGVGWETQEYQNYQHYLREFVFHSVSAECRTVVAKKFELPVDDRRVTEKYMLTQLLVSTGSVPIVYTDKEDNILGQVNGMESYDVLGTAMVHVREKCIENLRKEEDRYKADELKQLQAKLPLLDENAIMKKASELRRKPEMLSEEDEQTIKWADLLMRKRMLSTPTDNEEIIQNAQRMVGRGLQFEQPFDQQCVYEKGRELVEILHQFSRDVAKSDLDVATARFVVNTLYQKCGVNSQGTVAEMSAEWRKAMLSYANLVGLKGVDGTILSMIWRYVFKYCKAIADENELPINERIHATEQEIKEIYDRYTENLEVFPLFDELPQIGTDQMKKLHRFTLEDYLNYEGLRQMNQDTKPMFLHTRPFRCVHKGCKRLARYRPDDGGTVPLYCAKHRRPVDVIEISPMKKTKRNVFEEEIHMAEFFNKQNPILFAFGDIRFNPYHYVIRETAPLFDKNEKLRRDWSRVKELTTELRRLKGHQEWPDALTVTSLCMVQILTKIREFFGDRFVLSEGILWFVFRLLSVRIDVKLVNVAEDSPYRSSVESMLAALFGVTMNSDLVDLFSVYAQTIATYLVNERRVFYFFQIAGKVQKRKKTVSVDEAYDDEIYGSDEYEEEDADEDLDAKEIDYDDEQFDGDE